MLTQPVRINMQVYKDLEKINLIHSISPGYEMPDIFKGFFGFQCYELGLKHDIILKAGETSEQPTGLTLKVPENWVAKVKTAYKPNNCSVKEMEFTEDDGLVELSLICQNEDIFSARVYGDLPIAHLYVYEIQNQAMDTM